MTLNSGATIADRYRLQRFIAAGGMGEVWEATDNRLDRRVAVKVLKSEFSSDPEFLGRFRVEARTTAQLNHPGIAAIHDYGETSDNAGRSTAYLVMELVNGEPLNAVLARMGRVPLPLALDMLEQTGRALQVAHAAGLVHRDVKPGNILITPSGHVKITDFGIAKAIDAAPVTRTGMVMGTAQYISPEQALGQNATAASDVYSLGVVGYEAIVGRRPFTGEGVLTVAMKHIHELPEPLPADLPENVRVLIDTALAKDPGQRYADGGEFADAVAAVRAGHLPPHPRGASGGPRAAAPPPPLPSGPAATRMMTSGLDTPPPSRIGPAVAGAVAGGGAGGAAGYAAGGGRVDRVGSGGGGGGMGSVQRLLAWAAAALLVLALIAMGALMLSNLVDTRDGGGTVTTDPLVPTFATLVPTTTEAPTTTVETTTTEETTTEVPTTEAPTTEGDGGLLDLPGRRPSGATITIEPTEGAGNG